MDKELELHEIRGFFRRRKKAFIVSFSVVFFIGVFIALVLPPIYVSEAVISIEEQQIPEKFIQSAVTDYAEERIEKISQEVLSRPNLIEIIEKFDLYSEEKDRKSKTELARMLHDDLELKKIEAQWQDKKGGRPIAAIVAFSLSYGGEDPVIVQQVTETLSKLYLEKDTKARGKRIAGTTDFLKSELNRLREEISKQENIIREFKQKHIRELPGDRVYNLQVISRLERELDNAENQLSLLQERKVLLQSQLANVEPLTPIVIGGEDLAINPAQRLKKLRLELASMRSIYSEKHPDIIKKKKEIKKLEKEVNASADSVGKIKKLEQLEVKYASLISKKGSKHPDVISTKKEIAILQQEVDKLITENAKQKISEEQPDNPIYITFKTQVETINMQIAKLEEKIPELATEINKYQIRIENAPMVEKEFNALQRDYEGLKLQYSELSNKLMNAELAQQVEGREQGARFNITSPAYLPGEATEPNRLMIIILSFLFAIGISSVLIISQEYLDNSIKTSNQLKQLTNIPVLTTISYVETENERHHRRIKYAVWAIATVSCIGLVLLFLDLFIIKLDQAWKIVLERIMMIA